jgi:hypothetical protein
LPTNEKPISALWYMSFDPTSATDALKLLRSLLIIDLTTLRFPFKERHSCNLKEMIPIPTTIFASLRGRSASLEARLFFLVFILKPQRGAPQDLNVCSSRRRHIGGASRFFYFNSGLISSK